MNKKKQHRFDKLQKSSILFTQLGLVLALFVVYIALEFNAEKKDFVFNESFEPDESTPFVTQHRAIIIEKKVTQKKKNTPKKTVPLIDIKIDNNDPKIEDSVIEPIDETPTDDIIDSIVEAPSNEETEDTLPFILIEEAPVYPGCEGLDSLQTKRCFTSKISKFVNKKFNTDIASDLNLSGKQNIWVIFKIDKTGTVTNITAKAPHKRLEKEAIRIVQKLPKMTPGKQRKRPVGVKYTLPIAFVIE